MIRVLDHPNESFFFNPHYIVLVIGIENSLYNVDAG